MEIFLTVLKYSGYLAAVMIWLANNLISRGKIKNLLQMQRYQLVNFLGAMVMGVNILLNGDYSYFILQVSWAYNAVCGLIYR